MEQEFSNEQLKEIASQLSKPQGKEGIDVAHLMHETNIHMTLSTVRALALDAQEKVLEMGHGNGAHLQEILHQAEGLRYYGLEISSLMKEEAEKINTDALTVARASYHLYDGSQIPFEERFFDKIMSVNTIYFWQDPAALLQEIYRVLKPEGKAGITFAQKDFMQKLPFTQYGFELYDQEKFEKLVACTAFSLAEVIDHREEVKSKTGEKVEWYFTVVVLEKRAE